MFGFSPRCGSVRVKCKTREGCVLYPPLSLWFLWFDCLSFVTRPNFQMLSLKQNIKLPFKFHLACRVGVGIDYILCFVFVLEQKLLLDNDHSSFKVGWIARLQHCRCILNACVIISLIMNMLLKSWYLKIVSLERNLNISIFCLP